MNHLSMEQLVSLRGPGTEPGMAEARRHVESCELCRNELDRLHQRVARMKALPGMQPPRDAWPVIRGRMADDRHRRRIRWMSIAGTALAASVLLAVVVNDISRPGRLSATAAIDTAKAQSRALESTILRYNPEARVTDGRTARIAAELEDRIADLDRQLEVTQMRDVQSRDQQLLQLWRERVNLLDALVDVHVTKASNVGL
ncbi:MAG: hypothetical protein ABI836_14480 [Gemmatimonadota bacterium]